MFWFSFFSHKPLSAGSFSTKVATKDFASTWNITNVKKIWGKNDRIGRYSKYPRNVRFAKKLRNVSSNIARKGEKTLNPARNGAEESSQHENCAGKRSKRCWVMSEENLTKSCLRFIDTGSSLMRQFVWWSLKRKLLPDTSHQYCIENNDHDAQIIV